MGHILDPRISRPHLSRPRPSALTFPTPHRSRGMSPDTLSRVVMRVGESRKRGASFVNGQFGFGKPNKIEHCRPIPGTNVRVWLLMDIAPIPLPQGCKHSVPLAPHSPCAAALPRRRPPAPPPLTCALHPIRRRAAKRRRQPTRFESSARATNSSWSHSQTPRLRLRHSPVALEPR